MKTYNIHTHSCRVLSDMLTPVALYLKIRDFYPESALLESTEYRTPESSYSYIAFCPMASYQVNDDQIIMQYPDGSIKQERLVAGQVNQISSQFDDFCKSFQVTQMPGDNNLCEVSESNPTGINGLFGFTSYDIVSNMEPVKFHDVPDDYRGIPQMHYIYYRYVVVMNMYRNEMYVLENLLDDEPSQIHRVMAEVENKNFDVFGFSKVGEKSSNMDDEQYRQMVREGIRHCQRGDVFQIVLARRFQQSFLGDDFQVYRTLRSVNPSPYLFYFDFGSYRIFGSSPETHFRIKGDEAYIDPIAGTFKRTGDEENDRIAAQQLLKDPKENAEHVMLVDLARNDLSRHASEVNVSRYKELQFYSHVIHIVSRVTGKLSGHPNPMELFLDTFPAGTLSGAPKVRALQLIGELEPQARGFYGGCIGYIGLNGDLNQAITIRSFLSKNNTLYFQAGAGVVAKSVPESELQEVNNKLGALCRAIEMAEVSSKADYLSYTR
jgi:Anthranilate/para-aminobenzoate synthases component I